MRHSRRPTGLWLAVALVALACSGQPPTTHYYLLDSGEGAAPAANPPSPGDLEIGVRPFRVDPPFDQDRIVYRVGETSPEVGFYDYHRWAAPLSGMLPELVATAFRGKLPGVRSIEPEVAGRGYTHYFSGRLHSLVEVDLPEGQRVEARYELTLSDADGVEIWSATQSSEATVTTDSVERIVVEMRTLLEAALDQAYPSLYTRLVLLLESSDQTPD